MQVPNNRNEEEQQVERVVVSVRLRPFTEEEYLRDRQTCIETFDPSNNVILIKKEFDKKVFNFDHLLDPQIQQKEVYDTVARDVVEGVLKGYNGTIFAYGQTGTGKTYTMLGIPNDRIKRGIIPRALEHIFETSLSDKKYTYEIRIAYLQIYMEILQDLIEPSNTDIKIRESPESGVFITGNTWISVKSVDECLEVLTNAEKNRVFAFTNLNATSSRSHAVFIVKLEKRMKLTIDQIETLEKQNTLTNTSLITSILYLVDLAGSERVKKSKISGERLEEAISINSSLTALGKCIHALSDTKAGYVPFRDSKLTRILQDSLGGNSKTALIVNIGPTARNIEETLSSLYFGSRAMKVKNRPIINKQKDYYALSMQLQAELDAKDDEIHRMQIKLSDLLEEVNLIKNEYEKQKLATDTSDKLMKNLSKTYNTNDLKGIISKIESSRQEELEQLEKRYKDVIREKDRQHKEFLEEIDQLMLEQENEINDLKNKNETLQIQVEKMYQEKDQIKSMLEKERFQYQEKVHSYDIEKERLQAVLEQLSLKCKQNQLDQSSQKEKEYLARVLELEAKMGERKNRNLPRPYVQNDKMSRNAFDRQDEKENMLERAEREARENEEKAKNAEIQNLQLKVSMLQTSLETMKKEKNEYINKEKQASLKIQDLEATIIKFGDQKNKIREELQQKEEMLRREIAELHEALAEKDTQAEEILMEINEYKKKLDQTEQYYVQQINATRAEYEEREAELQKGIQDLNSIIEEKNMQIQSLNEKLKVKEDSRLNEEKKSSNHVRELECQLLYKDQEFMNIEKRLNEMNRLLQEKDDQITQLRKFIESQEGSYQENGTKTLTRISELEQQLQQKNNEYYKLRDEKIKLEQTLKLELQKLEGEYNVLQNQNKESKNREQTQLQSIEALKQEIDKIKKDHMLQYQQKSTKQQEETTAGKKKLSGSFTEVDREIEELKQTIANYQTQNAQLVAKVAEVQEQREVERARFISKMKECEGQINEKDKEITNLKRVIEEANNPTMNYSQELREKEKQLQELSLQLRNTQNENNALRTEFEGQKLVFQDSIRSKEEDNAFLVQKFNALQKEKEGLMSKQEYTTKSKEQNIPPNQNIEDNKNDPNASTNQGKPDHLRTESVREIEMQAELQAMENETLKMVADELREENKKLKILLRKFQGEAIEGESFSIDESREVMNDPSMLSELLLRNTSDENKMEDRSSIRDESMIKKNPLEALKQSLEQEIFQKEILIEEKEILSSRVKELETQVASLTEQLSKPPETEKLAINLKRTEKEEEDLKQTIKGLRKVVETNQNNFTAQAKKYEKTIQELNEQIEDLKATNDGLELQISEFDHMQELLNQKDKEINDLKEEAAKFTESSKLNSQKLRDLEADLKVFNTNYEKLEAENQALLGALEKSKYSGLEYNGVIQENDLKIQELVQEIDETKHINTLLQEKVVKLETELRRVASKKTHLEFELKAIDEQHRNDICQVVLDNCIMAVQMQELDKEFKESVGLQKMKSMFSNQNANPSRKWLQTVGQAYLKKNAAFSVQNFYTFIDSFSNQQSSYNSAYMQYEEAFSVLNPRKDQKSKFGNGAKGWEIAEVKAVIDDMILIIEVQDDIENQMRLNLNWIGIDLHVEKEVDKKITAGSPTKKPQGPSRANSKDLTIEEACKAVTTLNTSNIFNQKYLRKMKESQALPLSQNAAMDMILCDSKLLQKILAINEGFVQNSKAGNDLLIDLTTLFLNTYNYCKFIKEKNDFQERVIKDLQGVIQTSIRYMTFKEIELKITEKTKKLLLKRYTSLIKAFKADKKTFEDFSKQVQKKEKIESAVRTIQRFYRFFKQREMKKFAFKKNFELLKERKSSEKLTEKFNNFNAKTGKLLIQQSMNHLDLLFNDLKDIFIQKNSLKYKKFQQYYKKKNDAE